MNQENNQYINVSYVGPAHQIANELQSNNIIVSHVWFLTHNICYTYTSVILKRNEMHLKRNLISYEMRGGNLLISSTVIALLIILQQKLKTLLANGQEEGKKAESQ